MIKFLLGFVVCFSLLASVASIPGFRVEWTPERRVILIHGKVLVEVLPYEGRALAEQ